QVVKVLEKQNPGGLLGVVQFRRAASFLPQNIVDVFESLLEHVLLPPTMATPVATRGNYSLQIRGLSGPNGASVGGGAIREGAFTDRSSRGGWAAGEISARTCGRMRAARRRRRSRPRTERRSAARLLRLRPAG